MEESPIEAVNWRLACNAPSVDISIGEINKPAEASLHAAKRGMRAVLFEGLGWLDCAVYDRYRLPSGSPFVGPALVEERESTCVIGPNATAEVDLAGNLLIQIH